MNCYFFNERKEGAHFFNEPLTTTQKGRKEVAIYRSSSFLPSKIIGISTTHS
ncbi:hypothetical protein ACSSV5_001144 [Psychroflexus sp. MBR-150]|jgi:hypothetical protein